MTMTQRTLPLLQISGDMDDIDACNEAVGDWPDLEAHICDLSPSGQCEYDALAPDPDYQRCKHCGEMTG